MPQTFQIRLSTGGGSKVELEADECRPRGRTAVAFFVKGKQTAVMTFKSEVLQAEPIKPPVKEVIRRDLDRKISLDDDF